MAKDSIDQGSGDHVVNVDEATTVEVRITPTIERDYRRRGVFPDYCVERLPHVISSGTTAYSLSLDAAQQLLEDAEQQHHNRESPRGTNKAYGDLIKKLSRALGKGVPAAPEPTNAGVQSMHLPPFEEHHYPPRFSNYYGSSQDFLSRNLLPAGFRFPDASETPYPFHRRWKVGRIEYYVSKRFLSQAHKDRKDNSPDHWWLQVTNSRVPYCENIVELRRAELERAPKAKGLRGQ